jgi:hypothetical protein
VRVSSREAYVAPDRGAQGNALKTLIAMPFVLDGERGRITIAAKGVRHEIVTAVDRVRQAPVIEHRESEFVHFGTFAQIQWPDSASSKLSDASDRILQVALGFAVLNPHLTLTLDLFGDTHHWGAVAPDWVKWLPSNPTVAHWYSDEDLWRLIAGHLAGGHGMTVRELVSTFSGLARTAKQKAVCADAGLAHAYLGDLTKDNAPEMPKVAALLTAMKRHSRPVKPAALGVIGKDAIADRFAALGCEMESFKYAKTIGETDETETKHDRPWVIETAFAWCPEQGESRTLITGVNWSPGILNPFRQLGPYGQSLDDILAQQRARRDEPVVLLLHLACPRPSYSDRGKSSVVLG